MYRIHNIYGMHPGLGSLAATPLPPLPRSLRADQSRPALAAIGTIGGMLFGFDISSMSAWIGADSYKEYFGFPSSTFQGGITASMSGGSLVGALVAGFIADWWGRRGALKLASVIWIIGAVLQCASQNVGHLIADRVVSGLAIGITSSQCCVYLAELDEVKDAARIAARCPKTLVWQQLLGGNVMLYYLIYIFNMAGMTGNTALTSSIIQYVIFLVTTGAILPIIDRLGRRPLLIGGAIICCIIHFTTGAVMKVHGNPVDEVDGDENLKWAISGAPAQGVIPT
ncbi:High-affinity glucose transporter [Colletotrichum shisoi]|uniref:High-affinity glucose transporter n=1 Tax=Colletotrichum shisoi TaxID=2078593 RepID=A0A5Q4BTG4_9PEZI|nr:High-affinity glucose transporter [Colletotrichum shisoi]